ncbi:uncharacterized protein JCM15063_003490 [Sporobolomyces koalae]|uniref:uncharacterized protein n=1 Tax=Sporobolomyces koalae TaxID=500713 RepID=UPI0031748A4C
MLRVILVTLSLASVALASPQFLAPPQQPQLDHLASLTSDDPALPFVGAALGPFYRSTSTVTCDPVRISFGGNGGPAYFVAVVNGSTEALPPAGNTTAIQDPDTAQVLFRLGVYGIPGVTWFDVDSTDLEVGQQVALQVVDGQGNVGYSVSRPINAGHPNEFCYYPGAIWPPSRWDGTHFSAILLFFFLVIPFSLTYLTGYKGEIKKKASSIWSTISIKQYLPKLPNFASFIRRTTRRRRARQGADDAEGALQLEERLERGEGPTHVLEDDEDRTSLEGDEDNRPLLERQGDRRHRDMSRSNSLPPGYDEATRDDEPEPSTAPATTTNI